MPLNESSSISKQIQNRLCRTKVWPQCQGRHCRAPVHFTKHFEDAYWRWKQRKSAPTKRNMNDGTNGRMIWPAISNTLRRPLTVAKWSPFPLFLMTTWNTKDRRDRNEPICCCFLHDLCKCQTVVKKIELQSIYALLENRLHEVPNISVNDLFDYCHIESRAFRLQYFRRWTSLLSKLNSKSGLFGNRTCRWPYCQWPYCRLPNFFDCWTFWLSYVLILYFRVPLQFLYIFEYRQELKRENLKSVGETAFTVIRKALPEISRNLAKFETDTLSE